MCLTSQPGALAQISLGPQAEADAAVVDTGDCDAGGLELAQGQRGFPVDRIAEGGRRTGEFVTSAAPQVQKRVPAIRYVDSGHAPTLIQN